MKTASPKLTEGVAQLLVDRKWVDAITDEVARATSKFVAWEKSHGYKADAVVAASTPSRTKFVEAARLAIYEDANGRKWKQRTFWHCGVMINMVVKVQLYDNGVSITNKDKSLTLHVNATAPLLARMQGEQFKFFQADVTSGVIELGEIVVPKPEERW